jgi:hypothetical protein
LRALVVTEGQIIVIILVNCFGFFLQNQEEDCTPRDDFSDVEQLRVGNDGIFMLAFFSK